MRRIIAAVLTAAAFMAVPAVASADSGAITSVGAVGGGQLQATYTTTSTSCTDYGYCGWWPVASQVPRGQECGSAASADLIYVGNYQGASGTLTDTETFYPLADAIRLCLYISGPDLTDHLVAQYDYAPSTPAPVPTPSPTPTPAPSPAPTHVSPLTISEAKASLSGILRGKYHSRFTHRKHFRRSCHRYTRAKVRCAVRWNHGHSRYSGNVTMWNDPARPADRILYRIDVRRKRVPPLTVSQARANLAAVLRRKYHSRFTHRKHFGRACYRYSRAKVRCAVRWNHGHFRYSGNVTMWNDPTDPEYRIRYTISIQRTRPHRTSPHRHKPNAPAPPRSTCDPNYSGCLDPYASDYDCLGGSGDGPRYTGEVRVLGDDHFDLDRDGDGIACEPY